jgi:hypothetical protein
MTSSTETKHESFSGSEPACRPTRDIRVHVDDILELFQGDLLDTKSRITTPRHQLSHKAMMSSKQKRWKTFTLTAGEQF